MRQRIEHSISIPKWILCDFKKGPGGVIDLEFLAQYFQIRYLADHPQLVGLRVDTVFERLSQLGLLSPEVSHEIGTDYRFLRELESRARLLFETESSRAPEGGEKWEALERAGSSLLPEPNGDLRKHLLATLRRNRERFATPFESIGR